MNAMDRMPLTAATAASRVMYHLSPQLTLGENDFISYITAFAAR